jgi:hypothetical protein
MDLPVLVADFWNLLLILKLSNIGKFTVNLEFQYFCNYFAKIVFVKILFVAVLPIFIYIYQSRLPLNLYSTIRVTSMMVLLDMTTVGNCV